MRLINNFRTANSVSLLTKVDNFLASEFFVDNGIITSDVMVYANVNSSPELKEKMKEYLLESEVRGFDETVSDEEVFNHIRSKYETKENVLARINQRIADIRSGEARKQKREGDTKPLENY